MPHYRGARGPLHPLFGVFSVKLFMADDTNDSFCRNRNNPSNGGFPLTVRGIESEKVMQFMDLMSGTRAQYCEWGGRYQPIVNPLLADSTLYVVHGTRKVWHDGTRTIRRIAGSTGL